MYKQPLTDNYDFQYLIQSGANYVDKTDLLHQLIAGKASCFFLSRPRRFGKSLMISTLKYIFEGRRDLFAGLKIDGAEYEWQEYPVMHLNMAELSTTSVSKLEFALAFQLREHAASLRIELPVTTDCTLLFHVLLTQSAAQSPTGKVVLLVDEYDAPMVNCIGKPHFEEVRELMADFYEQIKHSISILRFTMITGVTRLTKVSIFSALNHMTDISMDPDYATMLGYTQAEVEFCFGERMAELAQQEGSPYEEFLVKVRSWYNGFCFAAQSLTLYNPVSTGLFLKHGIFDNYWFETGSPTSIFRILKEKELDFFDTIEHPIHQSAIAAFDPLEMEAAPLLLQSGYLTLKEFKLRMGQRYYTLGFPNLEVESAFNIHLIKMLTNRKMMELRGELAQMQEALMTGETDTLHFLLQSHIAAIPYGHRNNLEKSYQNILFSLFRLLGADVQNEVHINTGRVDCIIENFDRIYLLELKMNLPAAEAMEQIHTKSYYLPYLSKGKPITLIGMRFDSMARNLTEWCVEKVG